MLLALHTCFPSLPSDLVPEPAGPSLVPLYVILLQEYFWLTSFLIPEVLGL